MLSNEILAFIDPCGLPNANYAGFTLSIHIFRLPI
jgi:hypothetical protein